MARDGEILNSDLLQQLADQLQIGGVKRYPKQLNTDDVKPVYDLAQLLIPYPQTVKVFEEGTQFLFQTDVDISGGTSAPINVLWDGSQGEEIASALGVRIDAIGLTMTIPDTIGYDLQTFALKAYVRDTLGDLDLIPIMALDPWGGYYSGGQPGLRNTFDWSPHGALGAPYSGESGIPHRSPYVHNWNGRLPGMSFNTGGYLGMQIIIANTTASPMDFPTGSKVGLQVLGRRGTTSSPPVQ